MPPHARQRALCPSSEGDRDVKATISEIPLRICPIRDAVCPHGLDCPYSKDWDCDIKASRAALARLRRKEPAD